MKKSPAKTTLLILFFIGAAVVTLLPLALLFVASLRPGQELMRNGLNFNIDWKNANLDEYRYLFSGNNAYFTWYNEQKKRGTLPENADGEAKSLEEAFERRELSGKALACLHALEEPYKEVFMLSVFGGFSLKDVSAIFGKSESWARVTFYRARQKLMERMNQHGL